MDFLKEPLLSKNRPLSSDDSGSSNGSGEYEPPMASVPPWVPFPYYLNVHAFK